MEEVFDSDFQFCSRCSILRLELTEVENRLESENTELQRELTELKNEVLKQHAEILRLEREKSQKRKTLRKMRKPSTGY